MEQEQLSYEQALAELEKAINGLDSGDIPLDLGIELFQKGLEMVKVCNARLEQAEGKVRILTNGEFVIAAE